MKNISPGAFWSSGEISESWGGVQFHWGVTQSYWSSDWSNMLNFLLCGRKHCGIKNFWKVKDKAIQQLFQNNLAAQIPAYIGAFAQLTFFNFSIKLKECKGENPV